MEDLAVFIAVNHSGSFRMYFVKFKTSVWKMLPSAYGLGQYFQDLGHSFSPYGPPSRQITYI